MGTRALIPIFVFDRLVTNTYAYTALLQGKKENEEEMNPERWDEGYVYYTGMPNSQLDKEDRRKEILKVVKKKAEEIYDKNGYIRPHLIERSTGISVGIVKNHLRTLGYIEKYKNHYIRK